MPAAPPGSTEAHCCGCASPPVAAMQMASGRCNMKHIQGVCKARVAAVYRWMPCQFFSAGKRDIAAHLMQLGQQLQLVTLRRAAQRGKNFRLYLQQHAEDSRRRCHAMWQAR